MIDSPDNAPVSEQDVSPRDAPHRVVLVEDNPDDAFLFERVVSKADPELQLESVGDIAGALALAKRGEPACIVLDLGLPGMSGFEALDLVAASASTSAIVVLTGWGDASAGTEALARGAQDYLVKGEADGRTIARSIRFAVERRRSQLAASALAESELRQEEQHRLERALLVDPAIHRPDVRWQSRYIAARSGVVSGDFVDGIELDDGTLRFVIGDVAGHGTDEAALGVSLRAGWRSLVLAGLDPADVMAGLERLLEAERSRGDEFATVCDLTIAPDLSTVCVRNAGHPPPVLAGFGALHDSAGRSPLGIRLDQVDMAGTAYDLPEWWSIATYTDGLFEVRTDGGQILPVDVMPEAVETATLDGRIDADALIAGFAAHATEGWRDDVAVLVIGRAAGSELRQS